MRKKLFKYFIELAAHPLASATLKTFSQSPLSKPLVRPFVRTYGIETHEIDRPVSDFNNLHDLFTRQLAPHAREIDQSQTTIVSPVDAIINDMGSISADRSFYIKEKFYHLNDVLGNADRAQKYTNGYFFILYLSPKHYHRMHYPIKGNLLSRYALGEKSFPVNSLGMRLNDNLFATNYRVISEVATDHGQVAIVKVGALNINSIGLTNPSQTFQKGDEIGYFSFGSTVILFLEKKTTFHPCVKEGTDIKMGEPLGKWRT